ncbi:transglycosylase [Ophidiomyces ophidiicola]|nr:transglycosylase [Ophidiomyces ophidiicola]
MKLSASAAAALLGAPLLVAAQTFTDCNPLQKSCPPNPALSGTGNFDLTKGPSDRFTFAGGTPTYNGDGVSLTVAKQGDNPRIQSKFYMMFGHVEVTMKAAPGKGIVSSVVLQSDCLDEIDWEWLGGNDGQVQTNFFGQGKTATYDRSASHPNPNNQKAFHKYTIDWTKDHIQFGIDGAIIRTITPNDANARGQYPQTPMHLRLGSWAGGDPNNKPGTIEWAGGLTDYKAGPYTMLVQSVKMTDYSTGTQYIYTDKTGTWQSIRAQDGKISGSGTPGSGPQVQNSVPPAEASIKPSQGTTGGSWVIPRPAPTTTQSSITGVAGVPSSWLVTDNGRPSAPSTASPPSLSTSRPSLLPSASAASGAPNATNTRPAISPSRNATSVTTPTRPTNPPATVAPGNAASHVSGPYSGLVALIGLSAIFAFF